MNRILTKKQITLIVSLLLVVLTATGLTLAWLAVRTDTLTNIFASANVSHYIKQEGSDAYSITVTNDGNAPAFVRVAAAPTFRNGNNVYYQNPEVSASYDGAEWQRGSDGFYYYLQPLAAGATTSAITVTNSGIVATPSGYTYTVEFASEALQAEPYSVVLDVWPIYETLGGIPAEGFVSVNSLANTTTSDGFVFMDVAQTTLSNYVVLGGIDHPSTNDKEYYRLNAEHKDAGIYPTDTGREACTTAGGTIRFRSYGGSFRLTAVRKTDVPISYDRDGNPYTWVDPFSSVGRGYYSFDVYLGTGTNRTYWKTLTCAFGSDFDSGEIVLPDGDQEVMICLPYTMGFSQIQVGVKDGGFVAEPPERKGGKIGFLGSSITQGFDAFTDDLTSTSPSRTHAMQLCLALDADCVNFGFSGSCRGEKSVIDDVIAKISGAGIGAFIMDYDWNSESVDYLRDGQVENLEYNIQAGYGHQTIFNMLRSALGSDVPIVMMSRPYYGPGTAGLASTSLAYDRVDVIRTTYETARYNGDSKVAFISGMSYFSGTYTSVQSDYYSQVRFDKVHPSSAGHEIMAGKVEAALRQLMASYSGDETDKPTSYTAYKGTNMFESDYHSSNYADMKLSEASLLPNPWEGFQYFRDVDANQTKYTFYLTYDEAKWVNEIKILRDSSVDTIDTDLAKVGVYYSNDGSNWTKVSVTAKENYGYWIFSFDAPVQAWYFMLHMENPSSMIRCNWLEQYCFAVYDPEGSANDFSAPTAIALTPLSDLSLAPYTDKYGYTRKGYCFFGATGSLGGTPIDETYDPDQGILWHQSTNQGGYTYNSAAYYSTPVTFNTFTVFQYAGGSAYGNYRYAEIWYYNGELTGDDPLTYWQKANLQGVVLTEGSVTNGLCEYVYTDANGMKQGYTYVLSAPVTAKYVMVNFVYDSGREANEGSVFQFLSYAGYDANYAG